jgi:hypothetical protein
LRKSTAAELTESARATLRIESVGTLKSRTIELSPSERLESIAQLSAIEARRIASDGHDVGVGVGRESWREKTRRRIGIVDRRTRRFCGARGLGLHDLQLREPCLTARALCRTAASSLGARRGLSGRRRRARRRGLHA